MLFTQMQFGGKGEHNMDDKKTKIILSAITMITTIFKIVVQHRNQVRKGKG